MSAPLPSLSEVALPQLELLLHLVTTGAVAAPLTSLGLQARGLGAAWPDVAWLAGLDRPGLEAVLRVAIAERTTRPVPRVELVWTGPEAKVSAARDTAVVLRELFARAERSVLVAGFRFDGGRQLFEPLRAAMRDKGVVVRMFLHLDDRPGCTADESARRGVAEFLATSWPADGPRPAIYYDPRTVAPGSSINLHAKHVVVDDRYVLIGSANFTHNAMSRSIEAGVLIDDPALAGGLARQWQGLVDGRLVAPAVG